MAQHFVIADIKTDTQIRKFVNSMTKPAIKMLLAGVNIKIKNYDRTTKPMIVEIIVKNWAKVLEGLKMKDYKHMY